MMWNEISGALENFSSNRYIYESFPLRNDEKTTDFYPEQMNEMD